MKVIFLDVDGVLNSLDCKALIEGYYFVEDEKIIRLKELVDKTGAKVVLSSTWRYGWYAMEHVAEPDEGDLREIRFFKALREKLRQFDIELLSYTEDFGRRGEEIRKWLDDWNGEPIESYVILDDMEPEEFSGHLGQLVETTLGYGLEPEHVQQAIEILNTKQDF